MANQQVTSVVAQLREAKPSEIAELEMVKDRFIAIHNQFTGSNNGELIYHKEVFNYKKMLAENAVLRECSPLSLYGCFLDINVNGLSLEQGNKPDCYITPRNFKVGKDEQGKDVWEKRAQLSISPYGELKMRMRAGQIKYADNPVIVYEGDRFSVKTNEKGKIVEHEAIIPRKSNKIIASFIRIVRRDGSVDFSILTQEDINRLKSYSARQNNGSANALYGTDQTGIDPGFLAAKTIKHAFKTYPKVATGQFSAVEEDEAPAAIDYGINPGETSANAVQDVEHQEVDEFDQALNEKDEPQPTVVIAGGEDDEPEF